MRWRESLRCSHIYYISDWLGVFNYKYDDSNSIASKTGLECLETAACVNIVKISKSSRESLSKYLLSTGCPFESYEISTICLKNYVILIDQLWTRTELPSNEISIRKITLHEWITFGDRHVVCKNRYLQKDKMERIFNTKKKVKKKPKHPEVGVCLIQGRIPITWFPSVKYQGIHAPGKVGWMAWAGDVLPNNGIGYIGGMWHVAKARSALTRCMILRKQLRIVSR